MKNILEKGRKSKGVRTMEIKRTKYKEKEDIQIEMVHETYIGIGLVEERK